MLTKNQNFPNYLCHVNKEVKIDKIIFIERSFTIMQVKIQKNYS